jgi:hypothetical protein
MIQSKNKNKSLMGVFNKLYKSGYLKNSDNFLDRYKEFNKAWKKQRSLEILINPTIEDIIFRTGVSNNTINPKYTNEKLRGTYILIGSINLNLYSRNKYLKQYSSKSYSCLFRNDVSIDDFVNFTTSIGFIKKISELINDHSLNLLNSNRPIDSSITDYFHLLITKEDSSMLQRFYCALREDRLYLDTEVNSLSCEEATIIKEKLINAKGLWLNSEELNSWYSRKYLSPAQILDEEFEHLYNDIEGNINQYTRKSVIRNEYGRRNILERLNNNLIKKQIVGDNLTEAIQNSTLSKDKRKYIASSFSANDFIGIPKELRMFLLSDFILDFKYYGSNFSDTLVKDFDDFYLKSAYSLFSQNNEYTINIIRILNFEKNLYMSTDTYEDLKNLCKIFNLEFNNIIGSSVNIKVLNSSEFNNIEDKLISITPGMIEV